MNPDDNTGKIKTKKNHIQPKPYDRKQTSVLGTVYSYVAPSWLMDMVSYVRKQSSDPNKVTDQVEESKTRHVGLNQESSSISTAQTATSDSSPTLASSLTANELTRKPTSTSVSHNVFPQTGSASVVSKLTTFGEFSGKISETSVPAARPFAPSISSSLKSTQAAAAYTPGFDARSKHLSDVPQTEGLLSFTSDQLPLSRPGVTSSLRHANTTGAPDAMDSSSDVSEVAHSEPAPRVTGDNNTGVLKSQLWSSRRMDIVNHQSPRLVPPTFNSSLFGSSTLNRTVDGASNTSRLESSFYSGHTTYGGAAAVKQLNTSVPIMPYSTSRRLHVRQLPSNSGSGRGEAVALSSTAKAILKAIEAKSAVHDLNTNTKTGTRKPTLNTPLSFNLAAVSSTVLRRKHGTSQHSIVDKTFGPPVRGYTMQPHTNTTDRHAGHVLLTTTAAATLQEVTLSKSNAVSQLSSVTGGGGGKMKSSRSSKQHYSTQRGQYDDDEQQQDSELPLDGGFVLPISSFAPFNLLPASSSSTGAPSSKEAVKGKVASTPSTQFTFTSPIAAHHVSSHRHSPPAQGPQFKFSAPVDAKDLLYFITNGDHKSAAATTAVNGSKDKLMSSSLAARHDEPVMTTSKVTEIPASKSSSTAASTLPLSELFKPATNTWSCPDCFVTNKADQAKCPCCGAKQPSAKPAPPPDVVSVTTNGPSLTTSGPLLSDMFKKDPSSWSCPECMVTNRSDQKACPCCGTAQPKPATTAASISTAASAGVSSTNVNNNNSVSSQSTLADLFKPVSGTWSCPTCYVTNKSELKKCPCCDTAQPAAATASGDNMKVVVSSVSMATSSMTSSTGSGTQAQSLMDVFKKAGDTWDCPECMVTNKVSMTTCPCCSTPQPGLKTAATATAADSGVFKISAKPAPVESWECPTCNTVNKSTSCTLCNAPRPGIRPASCMQSSLKVLPGGGFQFGASSTTSSSNTSAAVTATVAQFAQGFSNVMPATSSQPAATLPGGFTFGKPVTSSSDTASSGGFTFGSKPAAATTAADTATTAAAAPMISVSNSVGLSTAIVSSSGTTSTAPSGFQFGSMTSGGLQFGNSSNSVLKPTTAATTTTVAGIQLNTSLMSTTSSASGGIQFGSGLVGLTASSSSANTSAAASITTTSASASVQFGLGSKSVGGASMFGSGVSNNSSVLFSSAATTTTVASTSAPVSSVPTFGLPPKQSTPAFGLATSATPAFGLVGSTTGAFGLAGGLLKAPSMGGESSSTPALSSVLAGSNATLKPSSTFAFGAASTSASTAPTSAFVFGQKPASTTAVTALGAATAAAAPSTFKTFGSAASSGAMFQSAVSSATEKKTAAAAATPAFGAGGGLGVFGAAASGSLSSQPPSSFTGFGAQAVSSAATTTTAAASTPFTFGASASTGSSSKPFVFGGAQAASTGTGAFSAQGQSAPVFGGFGGSSTSGPMFGSQQTAAVSVSSGSSGNAFSGFGGSGAAAPAFGSASSGGFSSFGAPSSQQPATNQFAAAATASTAPKTFAFGSSAGSATPASGLFAFGASTSATPTPAAGGQFAFGQQQPAGGLFGGPGGPSGAMFGGVGVAADIGLKRSASSTDMTAGKKSKEGIGGTMAFGSVPSFGATFGNAQGAGVNPSPFAQSQGQMFGASAPAASPNFGAPQGTSTPFQVGTGGQGRVIKKGQRRLNRQ